MRFSHLAEQSVKENIKRLPCGGRLVCLEIANIANIASAVFYCFQGRANAIERLERAVSGYNPDGMDIEKTG